MIRINNYEYIIGTGLLTGKIKYAPGTAASVAALGIWLIPGFADSLWHYMGIIIITGLGFFIGDKFSAEFGDDPSIFTADEFAGTWVAFLFIPLNLWAILICFIIWRLADIYKFPPARQAEGIKGGVGIVLDDIIAGLYACIITNLLVYYFNIY